MNKQETLTSILEAYRCRSISSKDSWIGELYNETYSNANILKCSKCEILNFKRRIEFEIGIMGVKSAAGTPYTPTPMYSVIKDIYTNKYITTAKINRPVIVSSCNGVRTIGNDSYTNWSGFQCIDMDIHDTEIAKILKQVIFDKLCKYNWFLGVAMSTSGNGLHIYTKIKVPEGDRRDLNKMKILYKTNFRHKSSFIYISCMDKVQEMDIKLETLSDWIDMSMFRPSQSVFITSDKDVLISSNFYEDFIYVNFDNVTDMGHPDVDWVSHDVLKYKFRRWEWFEDDIDTSKKVEVTEVADPGNIRQPIHYKHFGRWKLANTLVSLYGLDKGYEYLRAICSNVTDGELKGDCITAHRHKKELDEWAVNTLNTKHGFNIKINKEVNDDLDDFRGVVDNIDNPVLLKSDNNTKIFNINHKQYLGDIREELLKDLSKITLIEAGAGVGKTEMVKSLARNGKRVMMIMPFTSTIKSKVEGDKDWYYAYGNRKIDLKSELSMSLTIDKFSRIPLLDLQMAGFDYIFIDESHLMFQSDYRDIMPKVIDMIKNSEIPIIMMSGTPVGELIFFPDATHIKVIKEDLREKIFNVTITEDEESVFLDICRSMAEDISKGRRVIFPTNKGTIFKDQIQETVQYFIEEEFNSRYRDINPVKVNYYKKSNSGEEFMDSINKDKTIGDTDILLCSNYLSVGVDIEDEMEFSIYINDLWMPQEIEQFANRLRGNNLYIYLYVSSKDGDGNDKGLYEYKNIDLRLNEEEMRTCHSILQLCNSSISRNPTEYKYNSLISSIIHNNKYINYNEVENKYYLNETAYKVTMFEHKYREYVCQLPAIIKGMKSYGYDYSIRNKYVFSFSEKVRLENITDIKKSARLNRRLKNTVDIEELLELITDDRLSIYNDVLKGKYEIKKGKSWKESIEDRIMTVKNIEVFEKVIPTIFSFHKMYTIDDIKSIFEYCRKNDMYNFAAISRIKTLSNIVYNNKKNRLDIPIKKFMYDLYEFVDKSDGVCKKDELDKFIDNYVENYARQESSKNIPIWMSKGALKEIKHGVERMVKCLVDIGRKNKKGEVTISKSELLWNEKETINYESKDDIFIKEFILGDLIDNIDTDFEVIVDNIEDYADVIEIENMINDFNDSIIPFQIE